MHFTISDENPIERDSSKFNILLHLDNYRKNLLGSDVHTERFRSTLTRALEYVRSD